MCFHFEQSGLTRSWLTLKTNPMMRGWLLKLSQTVFPPAKSWNY